MGSLREYSLPNSTSFSNTFFLFFPSGTPNCSTTTGSSSLLKSNSTPNSYSCGAFLIASYSSMNCFLRKDSSIISDRSLFRSSLTSERTSILLILSNALSVACLLGVPVSIISVNISAVFIPALVKLKVNAGIRRS